ncbi:unnamed protein product [Rhizophagus irregularis]|nr:unnamed protein product [Rhizophagus irregularis]
MEKNNPFLVTGTLENQMTDKPEKLDYKTAADKLTRCLRDIVSTSVSADTIRAGINSSGKAKVSVDFSCTYVMLQLDRSSLRPWPYQRFTFSNKRARRKGDKMWVSVEVELKEKKLTNLQICMRNVIDIL